MRYPVAVHEVLLTTAGPWLRFEGSPVDSIPAGLSAVPKQSRETKKPPAAQPRAPSGKEKDDKIRK
jgi:hypothetical protein